MEELIDRLMLELVEGFPLHHGGLVFIPFCLLVCLIVNKITQNLLAGKTRNQVEVCSMKQEGIYQISLYELYISKLQPAPVSYSRITNTFFNK